MVKKQGHIFQKWQVGQALVFQKHGLLLLVNILHVQTISACDSVMW